LKLFETSETFSPYETIELELPGFIQKYSLKGKMEVTQEKVIFKEPLTKEF
jgi:hypothetical protein